MTKIIEQLAYAFAGVLLFWAFANALHMLYHCLVD